MADETNATIDSSSSVQVMDSRQFRAKATEEDLKKLAEYLETHRPMSKALPCPEYGWHFSYSFASSLLTERGIWEPTDDTKEPAPAPKKAIPFTLEPIPSGTKYKTRSVQISEDVAQRLKTFTDAQIGYQSKAVISQIISKGLEIYGA